MEIEGGRGGGKKGVNELLEELHVHVHVGFRYHYTYTLSLERWHEWMSGNSSMSPS